MDNCIFCKIISGELPSSKIYEDEHVVAFLDIRPTRPGHTLVVPKTHCSSMTDCDPKVLVQVIQAAQKIAPAVMKATGVDGFNLGVNNGESAGQIIFHLHMHVIPRKNNDGLHLWPSKEYEEGEMMRIAEAICNAVNQTTAKRGKRGKRGK